MGRNLNNSNHNTMCEELNCTCEEAVEETTDEVTEETVEETEEETTDKE
uniref:Uncharacterized protein n=1 Tax=viral metagenome TaxID=1070528 RepID=A0A6H1ZDG3_9ZZZZ